MFWMLPLSLSISHCRLCPLRKRRSGKGGRKSSIRFFFNRRWDITIQAWVKVVTNHFLTLWKSEIEDLATSFIWNHQEPRLQCEWKINPRVDCKRLEVSLLEIGWSPTRVNLSILGSGNQTCEGGWNILGIRNISWSGICENSSWLVKGVETTMIIIRSEIISKHWVPNQNPF